VEDFARYVYLPRLTGPEVLYGAIRDGLGLLTWRHETFGYADGRDEAAGRYRGLRGGQLVDVSDQNLTGLLVKFEVVRRQEEAEAPPSMPAPVATNGPTPAGTPPLVPGVQTGGTQTTTTIAPPRSPTRYHGTVTLDPTRVGRDAGRVADELIAHLTGLVGSAVTVTLEIESQMPGGFPEHVVRTVTENGRSLKLTSQGFVTE